MSKRRRLNYLMLRIFKVLWLYFQSAAGIIFLMIRSFKLWIDPKQFVRKFFITKPRKIESTK